MNIQPESYTHAFIRSHTHIQTSIKEYNWLFVFLKMWVALKRAGCCW